MRWITKAPRLFVDEAPTGTGAQDWQAVHEAADAAYPGLVATLQQAFADLGQTVSIEAVIAQLQRQDLAGILTDMAAQWAQLQPGVQAQLQAQLAALVQASAQGSVEGLTALIGPVGEAELTVAFGRVNQAAVQYAQEQAAVLVVEISAGTEAGIRAIIEQGLRDGLSPDRVARAIEDMIGITERQAGTIARFREGLETQGFAPARVNELVAQKVADAKRVRAEATLRTETINAATEGQQRLWDEAERQGFLPQDMRRHWIVTSDRRLCPKCAPIPRLNPKGVGLHEPFQTPDGPLMGPTRHPMCRCAVSLRRAR